MSRRGAAAQMVPSSQEWHSRQRDKSWGKLDLAERIMHERHKLTAKGFEITTSYEYDPVNVQYLAVFGLYSLAPPDPPDNNRCIFVHREPIEVFPSDELTTKIIMVVG